MTVTLEAIKFNYLEDTDYHDAFDIRKNKTEKVSVPEWKRGVNTQYEDSVAAYMIRETSVLKDLRIQARFTNTSKHPVEVRARAFQTATDPEPGGCFGAIAGIISTIRKNAPHVLGHIEPTTVRFDSGDSGYVTIPLKNANIWSGGVNIYHIGWNWEYRQDSTDPWKPLTTTHHRIYVILQFPTTPWTHGLQQTGVFHPWTEVLDLSCRWARWTTDTDSAASKITEAIFDLGRGSSPKLVYDVPGGSRFIKEADSAFKLTDFLTHLKDSSAKGQKVNCDDCATAVTIFSNILGCELWQQRINEDKNQQDRSLRYTCNNVRLIGFNKWETPDFEYHEVAWKLDGSKGYVFDACLEVDDDPDPTKSPHTARVPTNMPFDTAGGKIGYRDRLIAPKDRASGIAWDSNRWQRGIG